MAFNPRPKYTDNKPNLRFSITEKRWANRFKSLRNDISLVMNVYKVRREKRKTTLSRVKDS